MYDIVNFRQEDGVNKYIRVGTWDGDINETGHITSRLIIKKKITWLKGESNPPSSFCTKTCRHDETSVRIPTFDFKCCWSCHECGPHEIVNNNTCVSGPVGWLPNMNRSGWVKRKVVFVDWNNGLSIALVTLCFMSLALTFAVFASYILHKNHTLITAGGRELSFILLLGISFCFSVPMLFLRKPQKSICLARNLMTGPTLTMCYAPMLMKIHRLYQTTMNATMATQKILTNRMQLLVTVGMVTTQLFFTTLWLTINPSYPEENYYSEREELVLECTPDVVGFTVNLNYVMLLMILCTVYAFKSRKTLETVNESKYLLFTMYVTCAVWTIFFPIYINAKRSTNRVYLISGTYLIIGLITLHGLFVHNVYTVNQ